MGRRVLISHPPSPDVLQKKIEGRRGQASAASDHCFTRAFLVLNSRQIHLHWQASHQLITLVIRFIAMMKPDLRQFADGVKMRLIGAGFSAFTANSAHSSSFCMRSGDVTIQPEQHLGYEQDRRSANTPQANQMARCAAQQNAGPPTTYPPTRVSPPSALERFWRRHNGMPMTKKQDFGRTDLHGPCFCSQRTAFANNYLPTISRYLLQEHLRPRPPLDLSTDSFARVSAMLHAENQGPT
ncbi:hypothetical protein B0G82_3599 [Paraburkholderia sp. BL17N1]|nr:hypothetical protein B0G82_3599 [Paraburkholderia sp. BL17N1]